MNKNWFKVIGVLMLSGALLTGLSAQPRQGRGLGPCGEGNGPAGGGQGYGQGGGQGYGQGYRGVAGPGRAMAALDLSEEQQQQMEDLRLNHYKEMKPLRAKQDELAAAKRTLMAEYDVDEKGVNSIIDQQTDLQNTIMKKRLEHQLAMKSVLTDKQQLQLDRMKMRAGKDRAARPDRMGRGNGPGCGEGMGPGNGQGRGNRGGRAYARAEFRGAGPAGSF